MTLRYDAPRKKTRWGLLTVSVTAALLLFASTVFAGAAANSSFEGADGNLAVTTTGQIDWNSFSPVTWNNAAPSQDAEKVVNGWSFNGLTDAQAVTTDTGFAGGTKQDKDCASVKGTKSPNKDDLKRVYLASKTISGHTYLALAWERIPQNTVNASAHVGFEFNQGSTACGTGHDGLVQRQAGDMLIVYDFEGSSSGAATLTVRRWTTTVSDPCDVSSDSAPCWGVASTLTDVGGNTAEALVDTVTFPVSDSVAIGSGSPARTIADSLSQSEFGEAIVDLTNAGIFTAGTCESFGQAEAVSRSSGNSGQAAMEDLVGPASFTLSNCGTVIIRKVTVPTGGTGFGFTDTVVTSPTTDEVTSFSLDDGANQEIDNVVATTGTGTYTVTETAKSGYTLTGIDCTASTNSSGSESASGVIATGVTTITIGAGDTVDCTYTNTKNLANPTLNTAPSVIPEDTATVSSAFDNTASTQGLIHFELWSTSTCDTTSGGALLYHESQTVTASGDYTTANLGSSGTPAGYTITTSGEKDYWKVYYDGDSRNNPYNAGCTEYVQPTLSGFTAP